MKTAGGEEVKLHRVSRKNFRGKLGTIFVTRRKCTAYFSFFFSPPFFVFSPRASFRLRSRPPADLPVSPAAPQVQLIHKIVGMRGVQRMFNSNFIVQALLFVCAETRVRDAVRARKRDTDIYSKHRDTFRLPVARVQFAPKSFVPGRGQGEKRFTGACAMTASMTGANSAGEMGGRVKFVEDLFYS